MPQHHKPQQHEPCMAMAMAAFRRPPLVDRSRSRNLSYNKQARRQLLPSSLVTNTTTTMMNLAVICLLSLLGNLLNIAYVSGFSTIPTLSSPLFSAIHSKSSEARSRSLKLNTKRRQVDSIKLFRTHTSKLSLATPNDESDDREGDMDDNNTNNSNNNTNLQGDESSEIESLAVVQTENSLISNIKDFLTNKAKFNRESLSKLGMSALLAYGFVSNVSGVIAVSCAWFIFCKRVSVR
jgi:hypothetical protein